MRLFPNCKAAACRHASARPPVARLAPNAPGSTRSLRHCAGFTLVEVLVGATLSAAIMAAVLSSYIYMGRGLGRPM
jgi:prepilin-type N-terminal cleavage/methylation domain-containing protein